VIIVTAFVLTADLSKATKTILMCKICFISIWAELDSKEGYLKGHLVGIYFHVIMALLHTFVTSGTQMPVMND
jgi:hypothetical protein